MENKSKIISLVFDEENFAKELEVLEELFVYVEKKFTNKDNMKIYFSGEFDSNQTKFEKMSNHLEIGVIAQNHNLACFLLGLIRIIIDKNYQLLQARLEFNPENDTKVIKASARKMFKLLYNSENEYTQGFELNIKPFTELSSCKFGADGKYNIEKIVIEKSLDEIDIWTYARIKKEIITFFTDL